MRGKEINLPLGAVLVVGSVLLPIGANAQGQEAAPGQQPPAQTTDPSISGTAILGETLTASSGEWSGPSATFIYQWQRCDASGGSCTSIGGAVGTTYALTQADVGSTLRIVVTATNKNGSTATSSAPSAVVAPPPAPAPTPAPPPTQTSTTTSPTTTAPTTGATTTSSSSSTSVADRWYASSSAFNAPIPSSPPIHPNSAAFVNALNTTYCPNQGCLGPADYYSVPSVWIATSTTPLVTVEINWPTTCHQSTVQVPIPSGAVPSATSDPEPVMTVLQADTGDEWDFFKVTPPGVTPVNSSGPQNCPADSNWQAVIVAHHNPGWTGMGVGSSTRASGTLLGAGTIRPRDTEQPAGSTWDHAIAFAYNGTTSGYVVPAMSSDGQCGNTSACIPMGARLQLDPAVDCSTWPTITAEWMRQECRTLQRYGAIVVDSGNGFVAENAASAQSTNPAADGGGTGYHYPWNSGSTHLPADLVSHLRVIDWTRWTG